MPGFHRPQGPREERQPQLGTRQARLVESFRTEKEREIAGEEKE